MTVLPGHHEGRHCATYIEEVKRLKRTNLVVAAELLRKLVRATEVRSAGAGKGSVGKGMRTF